MAITTIPPIVFFGTGPVAAQSLELLANSFEIEAVITKPKPQNHRGPAPVLDTSAKLNIPIHTVASRNELDVLMTTHPVASRIAVLIDFGIIISKQVIDYFPLGIINSHFSILPDLRGADPITFAILSGQNQTGVSLMQLVEAMDEGPLFSYQTYDLPPTVTTPELTQALIEISNNLLTRDLPLIYNRQLPGLSQEETGRSVSYTRRLVKEDGVIDWSKTAQQIEREVRAYIGWPGSQTQLGDVKVIVTKAHIIAGEGQPGTIYKDKKHLSVQTSKQRLAIDSLKPSGKPEMTIQAFLAGYSTRIQ